MEEKFIEVFIRCYFIAFGVIIGGSMIGSFSSFIVGDAPLSAIPRMARNLRIWAIAAAIGGTFDAIKDILDGSAIDWFRQILLIISAMSGVKSATTVIEWLTQEPMI